MLICKVLWYMLWSKIENDERLSDLLLQFAQNVCIGYGFWLARLFKNRENISLVSFLMQNVCKIRVYFTTHPRSWSDGQLCSKVVWRGHSEIFRSRFFVGRYPRITQFQRDSFVKRGRGHGRIGRASLPIWWITQFKRNFFVKRGRANGARIFLSARWRSESWFLIIWEARGLIFGCPGIFV